MVGRISRAGLTALLAVAAGACVAAPNASAAGGEADSKIRIHSFEGGFYGYVTSPRKARCADGRRIQIRLTRGETVGRKLDAVSAHSVAGKRSRVMFGSRVASGSQGEVIAVAKPRRGCAAASSAPISNGPKAVENVRDCPDTSTGAICRIDIHFDSGLCNSFTSFGGQCGGFTTGTSTYRNNGAFLTWSDGTHSGFGRLVRMTGSVRPAWNLEGIIAGPGSGEWAIEDAGHQDRHDTRFRTGASGPPNVPGGPLHWDFENGYIGADVYVRGYLLPTG